MNGDGMEYNSIVLYDSFIFASDNTGNIRQLDGCEARSSHSAPLHWLLVGLFANMMPCSWNKQ